VDNPKVIVLLIPLVVGVGEAFTDLERNVGGFLNGDGLPSLFQHLDDVLEVGAVYELHHDEVRAIRQTQIENLNTVGVIQVKTDLRFVKEHADESLISSQVWKDALDRHQLLKPLQARCVSLEDFRHPACINSLYDVVSLLSHLSRPIR
jgi:hypothetical protein